MWQYLIITADESLHAQIVGALQNPNVAIDRVASLVEARQRIAATQYHLLVLDDALLDATVSTAFKFGEADPPLLLLSAGRDTTRQVGATEPEWTVLPKPVDPQALRNAAQALLRQTHQQNSIDYLRHREPYIYDFAHIIAESEAMKAVLALVRKVADSASNVLITGDTGTGKELLAAALHFNSPRRRQNFVAVNCAALPDALLESELFGHEKGAFTGAYKRRIGRFEQANSGTLFLDEIGDMSAATQAKVLRVLQERQFERVGGTQTISVDVRLVAAPNRNLGAMVEDISFREDLYYRLNVVPLHLPPLRERRADILPLAEFFLRKLRHELRRPGLTFAPATIVRLREYDWPGNVRELENVVERAVLIGGGEVIEPADLVLERPTKSSIRPVTAHEDLNLAALEKNAIAQALERAGGVQKEAAKLLGISPRAIHYKIRKYGLLPTQPDAGETQ